MMRTPFFILAIAAASMMLRVLSVSGVCSVMKSARAQQLVELDLLDAELDARARGDRNGSKAIDLHLAGRCARSATIEPILPQPMTPSVLPVELDAHEAVLLPLAGLGRGVGLRDLAGQREHHARWRARRW